MACVTYAPRLRTTRKIGKKKKKSQTALEKFKLQISRHSFKWAGEPFERERERRLVGESVCNRRVCVYACMFSSHELAKNTLGLKRLNVETVALISSIPRYGVNTHISDSLFKVAHTHPRHFFLFNFISLKTSRFWRVSFVPG